MSEATIALVALCVTLLLTLAGFVWWTASTSTEHRIRIEAIERAHVALMASTSSLERAVTRLQITLAGEGARIEITDRPPRG